MLEIKGDLSLFDTLQMLKVLEGSYIIRTHNRELHVKDGIITWFSGGNEKRCVEYIASYKGPVRVENGPVRKTLSLPIEDAVFQAAFKLPYKEIKDKSDPKCPAAETGWFAFLKSNKIIASQRLDKRLLKEILLLWKTSEEAIGELSEFISVSEEGIYYMAKEKNFFIIGFCKDSKMIGLLRQTIRRLKKHVHKGPER